MEHPPNRAEADRLLGIAEKLLQNRDVHGSRDFAILAQDSDALLEGPDQILAVVDVLLAAEKRINNQQDWYAILQVDRRSGDHDLIKKQYRRLALLLHPDKNRYALADQAFKLVADAWNVLSDQTKKSLYDKELGIYSRVDLAGSGANLQVKQRGRPPGSKNRPKPEKQNLRRQEVHEEEEEEEEDEDAPHPRRTSFWTACPYCYVLHEYPNLYQGCCLKCQNCGRSFQGVMIPRLPPLVPGRAAYYCCWGFFPIGFVNEDAGKDGAAAAEAVKATFPNWMPPVFSGRQEEYVRNNGEPETVPVVGASAGRVEPRPAKAVAGGTQVRKRGRPRKDQTLRR